MKAENINKTELLELASRIDSISINSVSALLNFISDPHRILYAHFAFQYFVFGESRTPDEVKNYPKGSIFASLQIYGSSKQYKGVVNIKGEVTLNTMFHSIEPL